MSRNPDVALFSRAFHALEFSYFNAKFPKVGPSVEIHSRGFETWSFMWGPGVFLLGEAKQRKMYTSEKQ